MASRRGGDHVWRAELLETIDGRWVAARDLAEGDTVRTMSAAGVAGTATITQIGSRHAVAPVYNLTVRGTSRYLVGACGVVVHNKGEGPGSAPLGRGSTADPAKGTTLPRNLREQLAVEEAMSRPGAGSHLEDLVMTDARWHHAEGWIKMQQIVRPGGGTINVHNVWNRTTGAGDDLKIIMPGSRPLGGPCR